MVRVLILLAFMFTSATVFAQTTCTVVDPDSNPLTSTTVLWNPLTSPTCVEAGRTTANSTTLVVPVGVTLTFDDNGDTWTGLQIEVYGTLLIDAPGQVDINSSIVIKPGGLLNVSSKLVMGSSGGCGYILSAELGGTINIVGSTPDRLKICGEEIARGGVAGCNPCPETFIGSGIYDCTGIGLPYCEPPPGFIGPISFDEGGLPIELLFFKASKGLKKVSLSWATASELNFDYFDVEKSSDGTNFNSLARIKGNGTTNIRQDYSLEDEKPLVGKNYYRLKAVDFDGYTEYFNVVMVDFDGSKAFSVSPNPSDGVTFTAETNFKQENRAFVAIYSTIGSEIARFEVTGNKSSLALPVKLESGVYYAKYISSDFTSTVRVLVK